MQIIFDSLQRGSLILIESIHSSVVILGYIFCLENVKYISHAE